MLFQSWQERPKTVEMVALSIVRNTIAFVIGLRLIFQVAVFKILIFYWS